MKNTLITFEIAFGIWILFLFTFHFVMPAIESKHKTKEFSHHYPIYTLDYLVDTVNAVCITVIKGRDSSTIGVTNIDCGIVPAGNRLIIEESKYVYETP